MSLCYWFHQYPTNTLPIPYQFGMVVVITQHNVNGSERPGCLIVVHMYINVYMNSVNIFKKSLDLLNSDVSRC